MNIQAALVQAILLKWSSYEWTVQGFGMLRTKVGGVGRIHIWDNRLRAHPMLSDIHDHPWTLKSTIISGELINQRFRCEAYNAEDPIISGLPYIQQRLKTGEGGGLVGEPKAVTLMPHAPEFYSAGFIYEQKPNEVHRSIAIDGCVTLLERPQGPPLEEATTYWPMGLQWVSAEPRPAKLWEIEQAVGLALARWSAV